MHYFTLTLKFVSYILARILVCHHMHIAPAVHMQSVYSILWIYVLCNMKKTSFCTFFIYKMNKQNKQICILPNNHCQFPICNISYSSSNKSVSIPTWLCSHMPAVFISAVIISGKHSLFVRFNRNLSFFLLNTVLSVNSTGLPIFPFEQRRWWYL